MSLILKPINIGNCTGKTRLEQILEQLGLDEENDFIWWSGNEKLKVNVPEEFR